MSGTIASVAIGLGLDARGFLEAMERSRKGIEKFSSDSEKAFGRTKKSSEDAHGGIAKLLSPVHLVEAGIVAVSGAALFGAERFMKFQESTVALQNSMRLTEGQAKSIGDAFLGTAGKTTFSAQEMVDAMAGVGGQLREMYGRALSTAESVKLMASATDLAEASGQPLKETTKALVNVLQAYQINADGAARASDILYNTSRAAGVGADELSTAVGRLHAKLGPLAPTLADVGTLVVSLADHGLRGSRGMMAMTQSLTHLTGGSKSVNAELKGLGLSVFDARGKFIGMEAVIAKLHPAFAKMTEEQQLATAKTLFGGSAANVMLQIIRDGVPAYQKAADTVRELGSAHESAERRSNTFEGMMKKLNAAITDVAIKIGAKVLPIFQSFVGMLLAHTGDIANFVNTGIDVLGRALSIVGNILHETLVPILAAAFSFIAENKATILSLAEGFMHVGIEIAKIAWAVIVNLAKALGSAIKFAADHFAWFVPIIAGVAAWFAVLAVDLAIAAMIGAVTSAVRMLSSAMTVLNMIMSMNPLMLLVVGLAVLVAAFVMAYTHCETFRNIVNSAFTVIRSVVTTVLNFIRDHFRLIFGILLTVATGGLGWLVLFVVTHLTEIKNFFVTIWDAIAGVVRTAIGVIGAILGTWISLITLPVRIAWWAVISLVTLAIGIIISIVQNISGPVVSVFQSVWGFMRAGFQVILGVITTIMHAIFSVVSTIFSAIIGPVRVVIDVVRGIISAGVSVWQAVFGAIAGPLSTLWEGIKMAAKMGWDGISSIIKGAINIIISAIDFFIRMIDKLQIHIPSIGVGPVHTPAFDWNGLQIPEIPKLHSGGTVPGGMGQDVLAVLQAGEGIIPKKAWAKLQADAPTLRAILSSVSGSTATQKVSAGTTVHVGGITMVGTKATPAETARELVWHMRML